MLSSLYSAWMDQLLTGPIPSETKATCDHCAMLPQPGVIEAGVTFHPTTRCCTFEPTLANYRAGLILSDDDPEFAAGRRTVEERLRSRIGATPWGLHASARFGLLYSNAHAAFGRAPDLGCQHQIEGRCGIWKHRPATCTTWFCKHDRGATGWEFWHDLDELLREADAQLGMWCALEMGAPAEPLAALMTTPKRLEPCELGGSIQQDVYRTMWGRWEGREAEYYRACAEQVRPLAWDNVARICGPRLTILARLIRKRYDELTSDAIPDRLRTQLFQIEGFAAGKYTTITYSSYDPLRMSPELMSVLPHFDGRPTGEVMEEIRAKRGVRLDPALVRRMADFRVLGPNPSRGGDSLSTDSR